MREDAEFCETRRATTIAEASNKLAFLSVAIGLFGCIGLLASLYFTRKATEAAGDAVVAAQAALDHTRDVSEMELRAYLGIEKVTITDLQADERPQAVVALRNYGQTPAYGMTGWLGVNVGEAPEGNIITFGPIDFQPGAERKVMRRADRPFGVMEMMDEETELWVHGSVSYKDAFGKTRQVAFRYAWVGESTVGPRGTDHNFTT